MRYLTLAALTLFASSLLAESGIRIDDPYVRAVPPGTPNSAAFMTLHNSGAEAGALVSAASPAAEVVELHTHSMVDGMMKMRQVEKIDLPAGQDVALEPGGLHIMLIGLKQELNPGDPIALTLTFSDGSSQQISAPVRSLMGHKMPMHHH